MSLVDHFRKLAGVAKKHRVYAEKQKLGPTLPQQDLFADLEDSFRTIEQLLSDTAEAVNQHMTSISSKTILVLDHLPAKHKVPLSSIIERLDIIDDTISRMPAYEDTDPIKIENELMALTSRVKELEDE